MRLSIDALVEQQGFIKDDQLAEYLEDKNLTPPDTYEERVSPKMASRYEAAFKRQAEERAKGNKSVTRSYGLKK
jgi:hypothetical protein